MWLATAPPPSFAGHVLGGARVEAGMSAPFALPLPGVAAARTAGAFHDSLAEEPLAPGGAWDGFDRALTTLLASPPPASRRTHARFTLGSGSFAWDEAGLAVSRGDSASWMRAEVASGERGAEEALEIAGRHAWGAAARLERGAHVVHASFGQRGSGARLSGGEQQWARGESGEGEWRVRLGARELGARFARGHDLHRSAGALLALSERRAAETRAGVFARLLAPLVLEAEWRRTAVARTGADAFGLEADGAWAAGRLAGVLAGGAAEAVLGAQWHEALDRVEFAPAASWRSSWLGLPVRVAGARVVTPVWSDLAPGEVPFPQRTWALSLDAERERPPTGGWRLAAGVVAGRTEGLARARRLPIEELWLRSGYRRHGEAYPFVIGRAALAWEHAAWGVSAEGQGLGREPSAPRDDPAASARAVLESRFALFERDLLVRVGAIVEGVTARASEASGRTLPAEISFGARLVLTIADATVSVRVRNLEDRRREEAWVDSATGRLARGPGRELRMALTWRLFD